MSILLTILFVLPGIVALLLLAALFTKKEYAIQREIVINAPRQKVFDYIRYIKNQDYYNKWVMMDPAMEKNFKGTDGTVGFVYAWKGNKRAGQGEQEIKAITEGKSVEMEIRFIRPFAGIANAGITTETLPDKQTKVKWDNASKIKYPINIMVSFIEKTLAKDMEASLSTLKNVLEK